MDRKFNFSIGEFYHVYNRGIDKKIIFVDEHDKQRFIKILFLCNSLKPITVRDIPEDRHFTEFDRLKTLVDIGAYCLMPNHFHLLLHEKNGNGVTKFLSKLCTAYSMYFNLKYGRKGRLFERTFNASHIDSDEYLKYIFAYIHLNPVKIIEPTWKENGIKNPEKAKEFLGDYFESSYLDYVYPGERLEEVILEKAAFPDYFNTPKDFNNFTSDWLEFRLSTNTEGNPLGGSYPQKQSLGLGEGVEGM